MNKEETPSSKMEYPKNQHLFNAIRDITGFTPLESDMRQILIAVEKDKPCSPPDEGAFAEWCSKNGWILVGSSTWQLQEVVNMRTAFYPNPKTTSELLAIFKHQTGR